MAKKKAKKRRRSAAPPPVASRPGDRIDRLQQLAAEYSVHSTAEKAAKTAKVPLKGELIQIMRALDDAKKVEVGSIRVTVVKTAGRESLDEMRLLQAGVSATVIASCRVKGDPSYSVRVSMLKQPRVTPLIVTVREAAAVDGG